jgi:hypothetical protein
VQITFKLQKEKIMKSTMINSRSVLGILAVAFILVTACSKDNSNNNSGTGNNGQAFVSVTNASGTSSMYTVYSDSTTIGNGQIGFGSTTGAIGNPYETVNTGAHRIRLSANGSSFIVDTSINFVANQHYSVFAYDTSVTGGAVKTLVLSDNLTTVPPTGQSAIRFLPLSPNATPTSIWLVNGTDTVSVKNLSYIGSSLYNSDSLAAYTTVNAGTYQVVMNNAENLNLVNADSVTLTGGKIYTIYSRGYNGLAGSDSLSVGLIQQN